MPFYEQLDETDLISRSFPTCFEVQILAIAGAAGDGRPGSDLDGFEWAEAVYAERFEGLIYPGLSLSQPRYAGINVTLRGRLMEAIRVHVSDCTGDSRHR